MIRKIIFYAPLGKNLSLEKIGGAEVGCLKTLQIYKSEGFRVIILHKPSLNHGKLRYSIDTFFLLFKLLYILLANKNTPIHLVGFYMKIVRYEWLLMKISKLLRHKVIYELRNGSMLWSYNQGSNSYRKVLKSLLLEPEVVLCQGLDYVNFIYNKWGVERDYYPNYILDEFIKPNNLKRSKPIRLIYFGRITESKNIDIIIEILYHLQQSGLEAKLDLIGGFSDTYRTFLDHKIDGLSINKSDVCFYGRQSFLFISTKLRESHYFLFPSEERQEGHSNSLTEAMGCGVVPIVSTAGFNATICGCPELVVQQINAKKYADKIIAIETNHFWEKYSTFVYERVVNNYTQSIVSNKLISAINKVIR